MVSRSHDFSPTLLSVRKLNNTGHNAETTLQENQRLLLRLIDRPSVISRKNLALQSGLKQATVTNIVNHFLSHDLVWETDLLPKEPGSRRRMRGIQITNRFVIVAVRINICYLSVGAYDMRRHTLYYKRYYMDTLRNPTATCDIIQSEIGEISRRFRTDKVQILGVGVGVEGPFILKNDRYLFYTPQHTFFDFAQEIQDRVKLPVFLNRACNLASYVLWQMLWGEDLGIVATLDVSYALDCGILVNGEILNGSQGMAGRLHDMVCGRNPDGTTITNRDVACIKAMMEDLNSRLDDYPNSSLHQANKPLSVADVIQAYENGDELAQLVYDKVAVYLGRAVNTIISLINPNIIFLCDEIPRSKRFLNKVYEEAVRDIYSDFDVASSAAGLNASAEELSADTGISFRLVNPWEEYPGEAEDPVLHGATNYVIISSIESGYFHDRAVGIIPEPR